MAGSVLRTPMQLGPTMRMPCPDAIFAQFPLPGRAFRSDFFKTVGNNYQAFHALLSDSSATFSTTGAGTARIAISTGPGMAVTTDKF